MTRAEALTHIDRLIRVAADKRDKLIASTLAPAPEVLTNGPLTDLEQAIAYVDRLVAFRAAVEACYGGAP